MSHSLDEIDKTILMELQKEGRAQRNKLSEIVKLSVPSVSERMRKLENNGLIKGYHAVLDDKKFNFDILAFVSVEVDDSSLYKKFVAQAMEEPEVLECHSITGDGSHFLKIRTHNTETFEKLLSRIQTWEGVNKTRSNVTLTSFKETREIPIYQSKDVEID